MYVQRLDGGVYKYTCTLLHDFPLRKAKLRKNVSTEIKKKK